MRPVGLVALLVIFAATIDAPAQPKQNSQAGLRLGNSQGEVILVSLAPLRYPPLARTARITGDVEVKLIIRRDGSVQSATAVSGNSLLQQAALNSAQQSRFECRGCVNEGMEQSLIYSFQFVASPGWPCPENLGSRFSQVGNHITVMAEPGLVSPYFQSIEVRSAKCFYLWRCGQKWGGQDYYFYRVHSSKCLGLWSCGYRLREPFATCKKQHRNIAY